MRRRERYRASVRLYQLDEVDGDLNLMPLAARRALDRVGRKLSLKDWQLLPLAERQQLTALGSQEQVSDASVQQWLQQTQAPTQPTTVLHDPGPEVLPEVVQQAYGPERPIPLASWAALEPLDRYVLLKVAQRGRPQRIELAYAEIVGRSALSSHLDARGSVRMVNVGGKVESLRKATAESAVRMNHEAFSRLQQRDVPKGDVLATARLAGITGAKKTADLIPLCHPLRLTRINVDLTLDEVGAAVRIVAHVEAFDRTGVEMEALTAASTAALTVYDMLKSFDRGMELGPTRLLQKSGGRTGDFQA